jgi:cysteine-rich repeat protein
MPGYEDATNTTSANVTCSEICGDGINLGLPCDDGNLNDGDGCSSICSI